MASGYSNYKAQMETEASFERNAKKDSSASLLPLIKLPNYSYLKWTLLPISCLVFFVEATIVPDYQLLSF